MLVALSRHRGVLLALLAVASFLLYAAGVLVLRQDRAPGWALEAQGAFPAAVSYLIYGTKLGAVDHNVWQRFMHPNGMSVQNVLALTASKSIPPGTVDPTTIDGSGAGTDVFTIIAMAMFGMSVLSPVLLYLMLTGVATVTFALRYRDKRLMVVPLYFLVVTVMLLTPLGSSVGAVISMPIGGQRYFVMAAFLPALHIFFEIIDRAAAGSQRAIRNSLLLLAQVLLLFGALLVRSSAGYLLGVLLVVWIWRLWRDRRQPAQRRALLRDAGVVACAFAVWFIIIVTALPAYLQNGRVLGNVWHRAFISFSFHPDWPFGNLRQVYDCTKYIPEGLNREAADRNGHCVWWVYPPNAKRSPGEVIAGTYDGEYEKALRQAYFYVVFHYPRQVFQLYAFYKSALVGETLKAAWNALLELPRAPVAKALFAVALAQLLVFVAFVVTVARIERNIVGAPLAIFPLFFVASIPPLYVAWASSWTTTDVVFRMYSCLLLAVLLLIQLVAQAILPRTPIAAAEPTKLAGAQPASKHLEGKQQ